MGCGASTAAPPSNEPPAELDAAEAYKQADAKTGVAAQEKYNTSGVEKGGFQLEPGARESMLGDIFEAVDDNASGTVSLAEFGQIFSKKIDAETVAQYFKDMDTDNSGVLSKQEFVDFHIKKFASVSDDVFSKFTMKLLEKSEDTVVVDSAEAGAKVTEEMPSGADADAAAAKLQAIQRGNKARADAAAAKATGGDAAPAEPAAAAEPAAPAAPSGATAVGRPTIHIIWRVPKEDEAEIDAYWKSHETWMQSSHTMGLEGDDAAAPRLLKFYIAKGAELNNPMDPSSGETGNVLYVMGETYAAPGGIASHMAKGGADWSGMADLGPKHEKYGVVMEAGSCTTFTLLSDDVKCDVTAVGQPSVHIVWRVPEADEAEIDAYWKSHETWMRGSHVMSLEGDDADKPRLTSFSINKGKELNNPMDPSSGFTGNLLYIMSETYVAPEGVASHMAKAGAEWAGMPDLPVKHEKYGVFMEAGSCSVFTNLGDKMK